jgi:beta-lactamase class D
MSVLLFARRFGATFTAAAALLSLLGCGTTASQKASALSERESFAKLFADAGATGTLVIRDSVSGQTFVHNAERARQRFVPASTFKIPNSLIALDLGVVASIDGEKFQYSGKPYEVRGKPFLPAQCNADVDLRTAFRFSCIPVYQEIARRVGIERYVDTLGRIGYGHGDLRVERVDRFWLEGNYKISALEQVEFLQKLQSGQLPFSSRSIALTKELMQVEAQPGHTLRGKTGYLYSSTPELGWFVGWLEKGERAYVFALNIDLLRPELARARISIVRAALQDLGAL